MSRPKVVPHIIVTEENPLPPLRLSDVMIKRIVDYLEMVAAAKLGLKRQKD